MSSRRNFPFAAIVGQERLKLALILSAINPCLSGVLIRGDRGTAKSTAVRALGELLGDIDVVLGCPYHCPPEHRLGACEWCSGPDVEAKTGRRTLPLVTLPVSATEDRVVGTLDLEKVLEHGRRHVQPGLLAQAHRGILYVDEVNLLEDHLVDLLLDVAAMGINTIERDGVSFAHPARFALVGTMNPEEGELRPQLLDRFAFCVHIESLKSTQERVEVLQRRLSFDATPEAFCARFEPEQQRLRDRIVMAKQRLPRVMHDDATLEGIVARSAAVGADGHRADLATLHGARALAAWEGRERVHEEDVAIVSELALAHRVERSLLLEQVR